MSHNNFFSLIKRLSRNNVKKKNKKYLSQRGTFDYVVQIILFSEFDWNENPQKNSHNP